MGKKTVVPQRKRRPGLVLVAGLAVMSASASAQQVQAIPGVIAAGVEPQLVQADINFAEGPVGAPDGSLYFSQRGEPTRTYHLGLDGKLTIFRENTNVANGLAFDRRGRMVTVEGKGRRVSAVAADGTVTTLADSFAGHSFLEPNDLIVDRRGGIYFTDPGPRPVLPGRDSLVFYLPPGAKEPVVVDATNPRPNGIVLSPDGRTLYVDNTLGPIVDAYDVRPDGRLANKRTFAQLRNVPEGKESGADGMAVDRRGRLYVATAFGIQIFDRNAAYLGTIVLPAAPNNLAFAGRDRRTLYVTSLKSLYRLPMLAQGPQRPGK